MNCKNCGAEMELWRNATHLHFIDKRWRCPVCAYEDVEAIAREIPEPKEKTDTKKK